jgi:hypothetical protein
MKYLMLAALAAVIALAAACGGDDGNSTSSATATQTTSASATNTSQATATPALTATNTATANPLATVCQTNPNPATAAQTVVNLPLPGAQVTSPVTVSGQINAFEAQFNIAIKDASGSDLVAQSGHSQEGQTLSPFSESVPFAVTTPTPACLWVFDLSSKDGSPIQVVQVPITLVP